MLDRKSFGKEAQLPIIDNTPTTNKNANHGRRPPQPLLPSTAVFHWFRHNASTNYIVGGALQAWFCFFARRGEFYRFLYQWELNQFFLTPATSAAASAAARRCLLPILRRCAYWAHHMRCHTCVICICKNLCCGGCFGHGKLPIKKNWREINSWRLPRPLPASIAVRHLFRCDKRACHIVGDAGHERFCQTCDEGWVLSYFLSMNF